MKTKVIFIQRLNREITFHIGEHQAENFDVIDLGKPDDLWFHAYHESSCHVVAILPNETIHKKDLLSVVKAGALLCKQYTHKLASRKKVEIIYSRLEQVVKTDKSIPPKESLYKE